jgi:DNA primase
MTDDRLLEEIKSRIDIVDFISGYVEIKKAGQNYKGLCPFHSEKTPSFMVSPSKQIFHCFGCGAGGDVITFLMKIDNLSFNEAKRFIAKKAGIEISEFRTDKRHFEKRENLFHIQNDALNFFTKNLKSSDLAQSYLKNRGLSEISIDHFNIGYAPNKRDALFNYLKKKGYPDSLIKDAGLAVTNKTGFRDIFRGRIMFPIFNIHNDVIAFGGRVIDEAMPKYINSPETGIFKKGETLFAINVSKDEIRKKGYAIIVEGYLDTIICHQYDFKNTVAPLGTALTQKQLQRLKLLTGKVVLVFDSDEAGIAAAKRSLTNLCECNFTVKIVLLPANEDPDIFLRKNGSQSFKKLLSKSFSMIEFLINTAKADKIDTVKEILGMTALIKDVLTADELIRELADKSDINESALRSEFMKIKKKAQSDSSVGLELLKKGQYVEEYLLLSAIITFPDKALDIIPRLNIDDLKDTSINSLFNKIKTLGINFNITSLMNEADDEEKALITELTLRPGFDLELVDKNINDCLYRLVQRKFEEKRSLALSQKPEDATLHDSLLKEKLNLIKRSHP